MSPKTTDTFSNLKSWLQGQTKSAALPEAKDDSKPVTTGAKFKELTSDVKTLVGADNVESATDNPATGRTNTLGKSHGLEAGEADAHVKKPKHTPLPESDSGGPEKMAANRFNNALKIMNEESAKVASADLGDPAQLNAAFESLNKAAAELPIILAASGVPIQPPTTGPASSATPPVPLSKEAVEQKLANTIENYRVFGADHGERTAHYLRGFFETATALKQAMDDGTLEQMLAQGGAGGGDGGGGGVPDPTGGGGGAPVDPAAIAAAAGGDGGAPPAPDGAGPPDANDHASALGELGLTPDQLNELIQLLQAQVAKEEQSAPPSPDEKAALDREFATMRKIASDVYTHVRSGRFQFKPAADGSAERKRRDAARSYFQELQRVAR